MFYVKEFLNHLKNCRQSLKTIREYGYPLKHPKTYFERNGVDDVTGSPKAGCEPISSNPYTSASAPTSELDGSLSGKYVRN
jgi:hypothetical protein